MRYFRPSLIRARIRNLLSESELKYEFPKFVLKKIVKNVRGNILDVGTGDGIKLKKIMQHVRKEDVKLVFAVEINPKMYEIAKANLCEYNILKGDIRELTFPVRFDTILAFEVIEHVYDADSFLKRITDLLSPDGTLILSTPNSFIYNIVNFVHMWLWRILTDRELKYEEGEDSIGQAHVNEMNFVQLRSMLKRFFDSVEMIGIYPFHGLFRKIFGSDLLEHINQNLNLLPISSRILAICKGHKHSQERSQ